MYIAEIEKKVLNKCIRYVKVDFALALAGSSKVISKKSLNRGNRQTYVDTINEWTIPILTIIQLKYSLRDQHNVFVSILSTRHLILFFGTLVLCGGNQTVTNVVRAAWRRRRLFLYMCYQYKPPARISFPCTSEKLQIFFMQEQGQHYKTQTDFGQHQSNFFRPTLQNFPEAYNFFKSYILGKVYGIMSKGSASR